MHVLIIKGDPATSEYPIMKTLGRNGIRADMINQGELGINLAKNGDYNLILLDLNLPDMTGHDVIKRLRQDGVETPILVLTAVDNLPDRVKALDLGADDFLMEPFYNQELIARIHAVVRRSKGHAQSAISIGKLVVNLSERTVYYDGKKVDIKYNEYLALEFLIIHKDISMDKRKLYIYVYGNSDYNSKTMNILICKLRKKLSKATGGENYIQTVWGFGYFLCDPASAKAKR